MTTEEAIYALDIVEHLESFSVVYNPGESMNRTTVRELKYACRIAAAALRYQANALPNDPLTISELREMDGEPVFLKRPGYCDRWALVMVHPEVNTPFFVFHLGGVVLAKLELEQGAKAYRRKQEEEEME